MIVGVLRETTPGEQRVALVPDGVTALLRAGLQVVLEHGAGVAAGFEDSAYEQSGARLEFDPASVLAAADILLRVQPPRPEGEPSAELERLRAGATWIGLLRPLDDPGVATRLARAQITAFALELMPRITRAQSMDALSSQNTVAGYRAAILAAERLGRFFPMLVTAAGTVSPARVFVIGAGVAGLQAIATAKRLGSVVEAYDTRPAVREQVQSVGARFVELPLEIADAEDQGGYARAQTEQFYQRQRKLLDERVRASDVVISTALVPGKPAPLLIEEDTVAGMRPGSVIVDLAAEQGGNCAVTRPGEAVVSRGVHVLGYTNLPSSVPFHASQMYSRNVTSFLLHLMQDGELAVDLTDELTRGPLLTHEGKVVHELTRALLEEGRNEEPS